MILCQHKLISTMRIVCNNTPSVVRTEDEKIISAVTSGGNLAAFLIENEDGYGLRIMHYKAALYEFPKVHPTCRILGFSQRGGRIFIAFESVLLEIVTQKTESPIAPICQCYASTTGPVIAALYCITTIVYCTKSTLYSYNYVDEVRQRVMAPVGYEFRHIFNMNEMTKDVMAVCVNKKGFFKLYSCSKEDKVAEVIIKCDHMKHKKGCFATDLKYVAGSCCEGCIVVIGRDPQTDDFYLVVFQRRTGGKYNFAMLHFVDDLGIYEEVEISNMWPCTLNSTQTRISLIGKMEPYEVCISEEHVHTARGEELGSVQGDVVAIFPDVDLSADLLPIPDIIEDISGEKTILSDSIAVMMSTGVTTMSNIVANFKKYHDMFTKQRKMLYMQVKDQDGGLVTKEMIEVTKEGCKRDLEKMVKVHEQEIKALESSHAMKLRRSEIEAKIKRDQLQAANSDLMIQVEELLQENKNLKSRKPKESGRSSADQEDAIRASEKIVKKCKKEIQEFQESVKKLESSKEELRKTVDVKTSMYLTQTRKLQAAEFELSKVKSDCELKLQKSSARYREVKERLNKAEALVKSMEQDFADKDVQMAVIKADCESKLDALKSESDLGARSTKVELDTLKTQLETQVKALAEKDKALIEAKKILAEKNIEIKNLTATKKVPKSSDCENCQILADKFGKYLAVNGSGEKKKTYNADLIALQFKYSALSVSNTQLTYANQALTAMLGQHQAMLAGYLPSGLSLQEFYDKLSTFESMEIELRMLRNKNDKHINRLAELETKLLLQ